MSPVSNQSAIQANLALVCCPDVDECKRADIFSHALTAHGLRPEHMELIFNYNKPSSGENCVFTHDTPVCHSMCTIDDHLREERNTEKSFDEWIWSEHITPQGPQFPEINWKNRLEQLPAKRPPVERGLIPIFSMIKAQHTPWCVRHLWSIQIANILADLSSKNVLECMMGMDQIFVDSHSLEVALNEGASSLLVPSFDADITILSLLRVADYAVCFSLPRCGYQTATPWRLMSMARAFLRASPVTPTTCVTGVSSLSRVRACSGISAAQRLGHALYVLPATEFFFFIHVSIKCFNPVLHGPGR